MIWSLRCGSGVAAGAVGIVANFGAHVAGFRKKSGFKRRISIQNFDGFHFGGDERAHHVVIARCVCVCMCALCKNMRASSQAKQVRCAWRHNHFAYMQKTGLDPKDVVKAVRNAHTSVCLTTTRLSVTHSSGESVTKAFLKTRDVFTIPAECLLRCVCGLSR